MKMNTTSRFWVSIVAPQLAGFVGSVFTMSSVTGWYTTIAKPALNPPNWVFGPVWTALYILMGVALFMVWEKGFDRKDVRQAVHIFIVQLVLNTLWSVVFFTFENPGLAFINLVLLWLAIFWTMRLFYKISKPAMWLLLPYLMWVSFAGYLNYSIWMLN